MMRTLLVAVLFAAAVSGYPECWPNGGTSSSSSSSSLFSSSYPVLVAPMVAQRVTRPLGFVAVAKMAVRRMTAFPVAADGSAISMVSARHIVQDSGKTCCTVPPFQVSCTSIPSGGSVHVQAQLDGGSGNDGMRFAAQGSNTLDVVLTSRAPTKKINVMVNSISYQGTIAASFYDTGNVVVDVDMIKQDFSMAYCQVRQILANVGPRVYFPDGNCATLSYSDGKDQWWEFCAMKGDHGDGNGGPGAWVSVKHDSRVFRMALLTRDEPEFTFNVADMMITECDNSIPNNYYITDAGFKLERDPMNNRYNVLIMAGTTVSEGGATVHTLGSDHVFLSF